MKEFENKEIYNENPCNGFDYQVSLIQERLALIPWLQASYGVAHIQRRYLSAEEVKAQRGTAKSEIVYPQGRANKTDVDLSFNDKFASRMFFLVRDSININPEQDRFEYPKDNITVSQPFSLILTASLTKLELTSYERLKIDTLYVLNKCPNVKGLAMHENMDNVWREFTKTKEINGMCRYPNYCLRIDADCSYNVFPNNGEKIYDPSKTINVYY